MITVENLAAEYEHAHRVEAMILTQKEAELRNYPIGAKFSYMPQSDSADQAFERLQKLCAQQWCEGLQRIFIMTYPDITRKIIEDELRGINEFIEKAKNRNYGEAFKISVTNGHYTGLDWLDIKNDKELEYLRLTEGGYYKVNTCDTAFNSTASQVYGRYVLFRQWLMNQLAALDSQQPHQESKSITQKHTLPISKAAPKKVKPQRITDIWLGTEEEFWRIVKTYANDFTEEIDGVITWTTKNSGITYLAGFTYECQQKGWIRKNAFSAPEFRVVYQNTFNITFNQKPFKSGNFTTIRDQYRKPFKGIQHKSVNN